MSLLSIFRIPARAPAGRPSAGLWALPLLAALSCLPPAPATADDLTPKAAAKVMAKAGYFGIGGVTHDRNFYYAAAISPGHRRVRVTVDATSGRIVAVVPLRGSGAPPPVPALESQAPLPVIRAPAPRAPTPYTPPPAIHPVGRIQYPFDSAGHLQPGYCRFQKVAPGC
ncbi:hypothetical protein [Labrys monachus]|uniref:PepSY domain-containing protein n=1 Tax=Labrys monachus TaxID=217067 RepID=A0ABU0FNR1_9HYPH|nr:hypothetical protein [Labrys monachus]MDQ0396252.1 hypothetical protein [Labrys monachus]